MRRVVTLVLEDGCGGIGNGGDVLVEFGVSDAGEPVVSARPEAESAQAIAAIAGEIEALRREPSGGIVKSLPLVG